MSAAAALPTSAASAPAERASLSDWMAVGAGMLGGLMALTDISIVNSSLPVVQGEIGATASEGTWLTTAYLIAEIVIIPLTGWLERLVGLRRLLLWAASLFTLFSMVCGLAVNLETIILGRIGQGLAGGIFIPTAMTIVARRLPPGQQSIGLAMIASTSLIGPAVAPLLGGWLTETFNWRFIFFINLPICTCQILLLALAFPRDRGDWHELRKADWVGIVGMSLGLGAVTTLLEEGHREQWFDSTYIWKLALAGLIGFVLIAIGQFGTKRPVVNLKLLSNTRLASCMALMTIVGLLLYTSLYVTPQFLVAVAGYNAEQAGRVVFISGLASIPFAFIYPLIAARLDIRILVGMAILIMSGGNLVVSGLSPDSTGSAFLLSQIMFGCGTTLSALPIMQAAMNSVSLDDLPEANALMSVVRNIGGAIGLAALASFQEQRFALHRWNLNGAMPANDIEVQHELSQAAGMFGGGPDGLMAAYQVIDGQVAKQAMVMMFNDLYLVLGAVGLLFLPAVVFLRPTPPGSAPLAVH